MADKKDKFKLAKTAEIASDKKTAIQNAMKNIEKMYGKGSIMRLGDQMNNLNVECISTGSLSLDLALDISTPSTPWTPPTPGPWGSTWTIC